MNDVSNGLKAVGEFVKAFTGRDVKVLRITCGALCQLVSAGSSSESIRAAYQAASDCVQTCQNRLEKLAAALSHVTHEQ